MSTVTPNATIVREPAETKLESFAKVVESLDRPDIDASTNLALKAIMFNAAIKVRGLAKGLK